MSRRTTGLLATLILTAGLAAQALPASSAGAEAPTRDRTPTRYATIHNFMEDDLLGDDGLPAHPLSPLDNGKPALHVDTDGNAIEEHTGTISYLEGRYWLYGEKWACGRIRYFSGRIPGQSAPPPYPDGDYGGRCGFATYSSTDLTNWDLEGYSSPSLVITPGQAQPELPGKPQVFWSEGLGSYVMWFRAGNNLAPTGGLYYSTSNTPAGPWSDPVQAAGDHLSHDFDIAMGSDGTAYILTDVFSGEFEGSDGLPLWDVWVQELNDDLTGTVGTPESKVKVMSKAHFEAVGLFEREGRWYATGGPTCANCPVPIEYVSAASPLGPWANEAGDTGEQLHHGTVIADNGCGGQNKGANVLPSADGPVVLEAIWGYRTNPLSHVAATDWDQDGVTEQNVVHGDNAQAISSTYWYPLEFDDAGRIEPLTCDASVRVPLAGNQASRVAAPPAYQPDCRVRQDATIRQTGVSVRGGTLRLPVFQRTDELGPFTQDGPVMDQPLQVTVRTAAGKVIERSVPAADISWAPDEPVVIPLGQNPRGNVTVELSTTATNGCYGVLVTRDTDFSARTSYGISDSNGRRIAPQARLHIAP